MRARLGRVQHDDFFQFLRRVLRIPRRLQREREIVARVHRLRLDGQRVFIARQRERKIPQPVRQHAGVELRLEPRRVHLRRLLIPLHRRDPFFLLLVGARLRERAARGTPVARLRLVRRGVTVARNPHRLRRRGGVRRLGRREHFVAAGRGQRRQTFRVKLFFRRVRFRRAEKFLEKTGLLFRLVRHRHGDGLDADRLFIFWRDDHRRFRFYRDHLHRRGIFNGRQRRTRRHHRTRGDQHIGMRRRFDFDHRRRWFWRGRNEFDHDRRRRRRRELLLEAAGEAVHFIPVCRMRFEREIRAVVFQRGFLVVQILLARRGEIQNRGRKIRTLRARGGKKLQRLLRRFALDAGQAQAVFRLRVERIHIAQFDETFFRRDNVAEPQLRHAEFLQTRRIAVVAQRVVSGELRLRRVRLVLLQTDTAKVEMRLDQIAIEAERLAIRARRRLRLAGALQRHTVIIPRRRVRRHQLRRAFKLRERVRHIALVELLFALEQRARPGGRAAG